MRKHDVRKWLHAILDLLPVILIPVFMIYSHRHTIDSGSVEVPQYEVVDFNQVRSNFRDINFSVLGVSIDSGDEGLIYLNGSPTATGGRTSYSGMNEQPYVSFVQSHQYLIDFNISNLRDYYLEFYINNINGSSVLFSSFEDDVFTPLTNVNGYFGLNFITGSTSYSYDNLFFTFNVFDLTQMFGSNIPSISDFKAIYFDDYYDYVLSHKELYPLGLVTYNDKDIMSQFTYQLYNSVYKYFNMGNVFHLNEVYDWFNLNIFNGQAPIYIFIVYQIVLYELIMDLLMLLYALFMWFIDMIEKLMEKPLNIIK